jgi:hypothetical protein
MSERYQVSMAWIDMQETLNVLRWTPMIAGTVTVR